MVRYRQEEYPSSRLSGTTKAALLSLGGLVGWRGMIGAKRALAMGKVGKQGLKHLNSSQKMELLKKVKGPGYQAYAKRKMGL
jgi:hypothetical protein